MSSHRTYRPVPSTIGLVLSATLLLGGCAPGPEPSDAETPDPQATAAAEAAAEVGENEPTGPAETSPSPAQTPSPSPSPTTSPPTAEDVKSGKAPRPTYAEVSATPVSSMLVQPVELEPALQLREEPSELGAVGVVTLYLAGFRDGTVSRNVLLMQTLSLPECMTCAVLTEAVLAQAPWAPDEQLGAAIWVTSVVEDPVGRVQVTVGMEQIVTVLGTDGTPVPTQRYRSLWDFEVEHTAEGWAVKSVAVSQWA